MDSDEILVLGSPSTRIPGSPEDWTGRIVERGSHQELLDRGGIYAKMWQKQHEGRDEF
jgi:ABC-type transport system involved in Fe-S cluster assembly fused permease/ATPase subunit